MPKTDFFAAESLNVLPAVVLAAVEASLMAGLGDGPRDSTLADAIESLSQSDWSEIAGSQRMLAESGLWLLAGDLEHSHEISQMIHSPEGSFWHGIMHRREGDFRNSKHWFGKVGAHPVLGTIKTHTDGFYDDPFQFVDACRDALAEGDQDMVDNCLYAQWIEWQALMAACLATSVSENMF